MLLTKSNPSLLSMLMFQIPREEMDNSHLNVVVSAIHMLCT
jgi:hypothetical protein